MALSPIVCCYSFFFFDSLSKSLAALSISLTTFLLMVIRGSPSPAFFFFETPA